MDVVNLSLSLSLSLSLQAIEFNVVPVVNMAYVIDARQFKECRIPACSILSSHVTG